eukprot:COSAG04_NODE_788_length_10303_cov_33.536946_13_plen_88_part_00
MIITMHQLRGRGGGGGTGCPSSTQPGAGSATRTHVLPSASCTAKNTPSAQEMQAFLGRPKHSRPKNSRQNSGWKRGNDNLNHLGVGG